MTGLAIHLLIGLSILLLPLFKMVPMNVVEQVQNVCSTTIVQQAWRNGQDLSVHGWIYRLQDGLLQAVSPGISSPDEISDIYRMAISASTAD